MSSQQEHQTKLHNCKVCTRNISSADRTVCATRDRTSVGLGKSQILLSGVAQCTLCSMTADFVGSRGNTGLYSRGVHVLVTKVKNSPLCSRTGLGSAIPRSFLSQITVLILNLLHVVSSWLGSGLLLSCAALHENAFKIKSPNYLGWKGP